MYRQIKDEIISAIAKQIEIRNRFKSAKPTYKGTRKKANEAKDQTIVMMIKLFRKIRIEKSSFKEPVSFITLLAS